MDLLDDLFEMHGGYVLDFSNATFAEFFEDELKVDIYDDQWAWDGTSKAKRLRYFLRNADQPDVLRALSNLWEYREARRRRGRVDETVANAESEFYLLFEQLGGHRPAGKGKASAEPEWLRPNRETTAALCAVLLELSQFQPQQRGYAFERFLNGLFDSYGIASRASFRIRGEQIDGSFVLDSETYLLEAKWTSKKVDAAELRAFNGKVEEKAAWSRGLMVSESGFSEDGLHAFGRGKRVVCMDGLDLYEMLQRALPFGEVLARKVRAAAETGQVFVRVRDLM